MFDLPVLVIGFVGLGIWALFGWLLTGHVPHFVEYGLFSLVTVSLLDGLDNQFRVIRKNGDDLKKQIGDWKQELEQIKKQIDTINEHLTQFKIDFDEFAQEAKNREM